MKTGKELCEERGLRFDDYPDGSIPAEAFAKVGLPLVVACTHCLMTMALPSALIDEDNMVYCDDCGDPGD